MKQCGVAGIFSRAVGPVRRIGKQHQGGAAVAGGLEIVSPEAAIMFGETDTERALQFLAGDI